MNRVIGLLLISSACFGTLYGNNEFLIAEDWCVTTNRSSSFIQPKCNSNEMHGYEYALAAYKIYNGSRITSEIISIDLICETKLMLEFYFDCDDKEYGHVEFDFNINSNYVYIIDSRDESTRIYEDSNDAIYHKLINLYSSYKKSILK